MKVPGIMVLLVMVTIASVGAEDPPGQGVPSPPARDTLAVEAARAPSDSPLDQAVDDIFREFEGEVERNYAEYQARVEAVWNEYRESTKRVWVDYSEDVSALSEVDFEDGVLSLETVIPVTEDDPATVEAEILERLRNSMSEENAAGVSPLEGQLAFGGTGETVGGENAGRFFREEVRPNLTKESLESNDGVTRVHYSVKLHLIPDHLQVRARKFLPEVLEFAGKYGLRPALVLAVIHTESWFNPLAASGAGAYGLMQLIPRFGAKDAYRFVYGETSAPSEAFLFVPRNNIQLGTAYLYLLRRNQLRYRRDDEKAKILMLCAYNWGPGAVNRKIIGPNRIEEMDAAELARIIRERAPEETANYFSTILEREKVYERMFD